MPPCYTRGDGSAVITKGGAAPLCYNRGVGSTVIPGGAAGRFHDITAAPAAIRNYSSPDPSLITAESAPRLYLGGAAPPPVITAETAPRLYRGGAPLCYPRGEQLRVASSVGRSKQSEEKNA